MFPAKEAAARMVQQQLRSRGIQDQRVLDAMQIVPRHEFVPDQDIATAYSDHALATSEGQTISQPYVVARMSELLGVQPGQTVLEIGTGSGYQTAVLLELGARVVSVERFPSLADAARARLQTLYPQGEWEIAVGDGSEGWPAEAPFDRILVTAAAPSVPPALREQLKDAGRLVIPVGERYTQTLCLYVREGQQLREHRDFPCRFVPLVGKAGWHPGP